MREYLDSVIKANQCAQYVEDIGIAGNTLEQLVKNISAVFKCIRTAALKLTIEKYRFGVTQAKFFGRTIIPIRVAPEDQKVKTFLSKVGFPKSKKQVQNYIGFEMYGKKATPLKVNDYCYVLNPKPDNQSMKFALKDCIWTGPYIVVEVLSNNNYVVRRKGTRCTQTLHRIRLGLYPPVEQSAST